MNDNTDRTDLVTAIEVENSISENFDENNNLNTSISESDCKLKFVKAAVNSLVQLLIGGSMCVTLWFAFKTRPIDVFHLHIGLSVIGYQLLLAHGLICLRGSAFLSLPYKQRRRIHWVLQLTGSIIAIAGSVIIIREESEHFKTTHGKLALAALIFTCASLLNGLTTLYSVELRRYIPIMYSKLSHSIFGTAAIILSSVSLAFGYNKEVFKKWANEEFAFIMIGVVTFYTFMITIMPFFSLIKRLLKAIN